MAERKEGERTEFLRETARNFPDGPGIYIFKGPSDKVLYVGKALSLRKRIASYFARSNQGGLKLASLLHATHRLEYVLTADEAQALLMEDSFIKKHRPRYNILLRDDKTYPYLKLTLQEPFPRVLITRRPSSGDGSRSYGPYPNMKLRELLKVIYRYFNLRDCDIEIDGKAERACLSYQIHQCPAPCIGLSQEADYRKLVERVRWFLEGKHEGLLEHVEKEMLRASERQEFEEAAKLRDLQGAIRGIQGHYTVVAPKEADLDVVALAQGTGKVLASVLQVRAGRVVGHLRLTLENELELPLEEAIPPFLDQYYAAGTSIPPEILLPKGSPAEPSQGPRLSERRGGAVELKTETGGWRAGLRELADQNVLAALKDDIQGSELLNELRRVLGMRKVPRRIACFDISTLQGSFTVGSAIMFRDGVPEKDRYRKFRIRESEGQDDFQGHAEMMRRYLSLLDREGLPSPDLFLIDGGKGQLGAVEPLLRQRFGKDLALASLAKREEEVFVPGDPRPLDLKGHEKVRHLLMRVRDESHRFAVGYHRFLRDRQAVTSLLRRVKGIGPTRLRALLNRFDSLQGIRKAPLEDLASVPGFPKELAHQLFQELQKGS